MKKITFKIESDEKEFAYSIDLDKESFEKIKHVLLRKIEQSIIDLLEE